MFPLAWMTWKNLILYLVMWPTITLFSPVDIQLTFLLTRIWKCKRLEKCTSLRATVWIHETLKWNTSVKYTILSLDLKIYSIIQISIWVKNEIFLYNTKQYIWIIKTWILNFFSFYLAFSLKNRSIDGHRCWKIF